jgi:hypothetical protein
MESLACQKLIGAVKALKTGKRLRAPLDVSLIGLNDKQIQRFKAYFTHFRHRQLFFLFDF